MNGKLILIIFFCMNLVSYAFSIGCITDEEMNCEKVGNDALTKLFLSNNSLIVDDSTTQSGGYALSDDFQNASEELTKQESGIVSSAISGLSVFLDVVKIIFAMVILLTPFPILSFFISLNLPVYATILMSAPFVILYVLSMTEFIGGRQL